MLAEGGGGGGCESFSYQSSREPSDLGFWRKYCESSAGQIKQFIGLLVAPGPQFATSELACSHCSHLLILTDGSNLTGEQLSAISCLTAHLLAQRLKLRLP